MKRVLILFVGAFTLFSCGVDEVGLEVSDNATPNSAISSQYSISEEEALANLYAFMGEGGDSRSSDNRVVSTVLPVKYGDLGTRAVDGIDCENLLYIANFENAEGYAVLAGDTRIEDEVIAIIDEGSLEPELLNHLVEWEPNGRTYYEEFPMTGPGFFTLPETGDELYINPNTVDFYDTETQDYLVGNYDASEYTIVTRSLTNPEGSNEGTNETFMLDMCISYAMRGLIDFDPNPRDDGDGDEYDCVITYSDWETTSIVEPLLVDFVNWNQDPPFNDLYPIVKQVFGFKTRRAFAGCMPLATAKILTYHEYPATKDYNGTLISWWRLKENYDTVLGRESAAALLKWISISCLSLHFYEGTFTFPKCVKWFLQSIDFEDVELVDYDFNTVKDMIDSDKPLIISSIPGIDITSSHAWNIDGYKTKIRTKTIEKYLGRELISITTETESIKMVHCDLGWSGSNNGYYTSGVFRSDRSEIEHDSYYNNPYVFNYTTLTRIITYQLP
ncbi:MAG: C10 family peptidase [Tidjanibacter sp.]|nr:C10 family peptidase [Tidjanibacter sp.]